MTLFLFIGLCALLCFVILIQESKSLGLGASFGGDAGDSLFGTSTASVLKKFYGVSRWDFHNHMLDYFTLELCNGKNKKRSTQFEY